MDRRCDFTLHPGYLLAWCWRRRAVDVLAPSAALIRICQITTGWPFFRPIAFKRWNECASYPVRWPRPVSVRPKVADPKGNWSVGCTPTTPDEPFTHMAWAATDGSFWVVAWERGGIYYDGDVALFRLDSGGRTELIWGRTLDQPRTKTSEKRPPTSFETFQRMLD